MNLKNADKDTSVIPKGDYCYGENGICPYWSTNPDYDEMECGYCSYIEKGDWELNDDKKWRLTYAKGEKVTDSELNSAHEIGMYMSLLWDQCKECGVKLEEGE